MKPQPIKLRKEIVISALYAVHYLELVQDFSFQPEAHEDYWELVYVDRGQVLVTAGEEEFSMGRGELIFHAPGETHGLRADSQKATNILVLNFECRSRAVEQLRGCRLRSLTDTQRMLLRLVLNESRAAFSSRLDDPKDDTLIRSKNAPFGCEQMIYQTLCELLLNICRQLQTHESMDQKLGSLPILDAIILYMEQHLSCKLTLAQLSEEFHISTSYIQRLFSQYKQTGAIRFFTEMKITRAKQLLRSKRQNVSQVAEELGYENTYYFCNQFKKFTGKSPREYRQSVSALMPQTEKYISDKKVKSGGK